MGKDLFARMDARIDRSRLGYTLVIGTVEVPGHFFNQPRTINLPSGDVQGVAISFDCQYVAEIGQLAVGELVTVEDHGNFRFLREILPGGDDSGMTTIELGTVK